jgi:hypothetical protein
MIFLSSDFLCLQGRAFCFSWVFGFLFWMELLGIPRLGSAFVVAQSPAAIMCVFFQIDHVYCRILPPTCFLMSLVGDVDLYGCGR